MAADAAHFIEWEHVSYLRDYARGYFNTLIDVSTPAELNHPEQYRRGATHALVALRAWSGPLARNPTDTYLRRWEGMTLADAALERRANRSLTLCLERVKSKQKQLREELANHEPRSHPTLDALRHLLVRAAGEARQLAKEIAARKKNPYPCLACPAALLCRDQHLACNQYFRFATINEMSQQKRNNIPREDRKPTEETTMEKMPPSRYWHDLIFRGGR